METCFENIDKKRGMCYHCKSESEGIFWEKTLGRRKAFEKWERSVFQRIPAPVVLVFSLDFVTSLGGFLREKSYEMLRVLFGYRPLGVCALTKRLSFLYFSPQSSKILLL